MISSSTQPAPASQQKRSSLNRSGLQDKTLWDWLSLLLVPLLIGLGTIWVTAQQTTAQNALSQQLHDSDKRQHDSDQVIAQQARYNDLLKDYRDGIDTLLLTSNLRMSSPGSDVRRIAGARTLDILQQVDVAHKRLVIDYLAHLELVQGGYLDSHGTWHQQEPLVSLNGADLSGVILSNTDLHGADLSGVILRKADLNHAYLSGAYLSGADLSGVTLSNADIRGASIRGANLRGANLSNANLSYANLSGATLSRAFLSRADLSRADLSRTDLHEATLREADLSGANLREADLSNANLRATVGTIADQLSQAADLSGAIMSDGTKHSCKPGEEQYCS